MRDSLKETQVRYERHMAIDPVSTRPTTRMNARVAGDMALFDNDDMGDSSSERMVIWRWQLRRRRR
jgi:hypothetical protein